MKQQPPSPLSEHKKARHDLDTMDVDSSEATETSISLRSTMEISDRDILRDLRPVVLQLDVHNDSASLCSWLETLNFLQLHSSKIKSESKEVIFEKLNQIYRAARSREAKNCHTTEMLQYESLRQQLRFEMRFYIQSWNASTKSRK
jgi:hypothetical protein